jgi:hydrogenase maturation protease
MQKHKVTIVGGLGNPLMMDEGIGLHILWNLMSQSHYYHNVDFVELGTSLMTMIHAIAGSQRAILIDCARMNEPPGAIRRFTPDEVISNKTVVHFSLHEGDLLGALELSRRLGEYPEKVVIYGIQPERIEPGGQLSPLLCARLNSYVEMVSRELGERENAQLPNSTGYTAGGVVGGCEI